MTVDERILKPEERAAFTLRALYADHGYRQYKMSKFEEYDLYVKNKDFLISDNIITFTDTNGKLMALKPDVTLSIIRSTKDLPDGVEKVYYDENVYRVSKGTHRFREITQSGLECIGSVDRENLCEVISLAAQSLRKLSHACILDLSHLDILQAVINSLNVPQETATEIQRRAGEKNLHEIDALCKEADADPAAAEIFKQLVQIYGSPHAVLPQLAQLLKDTDAEPALEEFASVLSVLDQLPVKDVLRIDFSVVGDMRYYNGVVFKGFIEGIPGSVLSGGQYNRLMRRMHRNAGAIGFAVYLDMLERLQEGGGENG